jgi:hypothetical protein
MAVLDFKRPEPEPEETLRGRGYCIECQHEWEAVAPVGVRCFECPSCGTHKGTWLGVVEPPAERWECNCGGQLFFCTPTGFDCAKCGTTQENF